MEWQDLFFRQPSNQNAGNASALYDHWYLEWHTGMRDRLQNPVFSRGVMLPSPWSPAGEVTVSWQKQAVSNSDSFLPPTTTNLPPLVPGQSSYAHCFTQFPRNSMHLRGTEKKKRIRVRWWYSCIHMYFVAGFKKKQQNKQNSLESRGFPPTELYT